MMSNSKRHHGSSDEDDIIIDSDPDQGDGSWEINRINGHRIERGKLIYHVLWKLKPGQQEDWSDSENWVPAEQMKAPEMVEHYKKKLSPHRLADLERAAAPEVRRRSERNLEGFVVSDDEIDPPTKAKNRHHHQQTTKKKNVEKPHRARTSPEIVDLSSSSDDSDSSSDEQRKSRGARSTQSSEDSTRSSDSSIDNFVVSDTEEGLQIPVKIKKKDRTPSPVVVSHRKKPTWQKTFNMEKKDNFIFNSSDSDPDIVSDDEVRHEAFLEEAKRDTEKKKKERAEKRKLKEKCRKQSPVRRVTPSDSSSSDDILPPRRRARKMSGTNNNTISVDREKIREQANRMKNHPSSSKQYSRGTINYCSDGISLSRYNVSVLKDRLKNRENSNGSYKAKESLLQEDELVWRRSPPSDDSSSRSCGDSYSLEPVTVMAPQLPQDWNDSKKKSFVNDPPLIEDIEDDVAILEDDDIEENADDVMEEVDNDEEDEEDLLRQRVLMAMMTSDSDDDDVAELMGDDDEEEDDDMDSEDGDDMPVNEEDALLLPSDDPFFDDYQRFAEECFQFKYDALENDLKPVQVMQFYELPSGDNEEEVDDWCMVIFENKPGATPKHVCEGVLTEDMMEIDMKLVVDCEMRLRQNSAMPLQLATGMFDTVHRPPAE